MLTIGAAATYQGPTNILEGTVSWRPWPSPLWFDFLAMNGSGSVNAPIVDSSGNGFNATYSGGGASYVSPPGPFGGGINTNGGLFAIPANAKFANLNSWTDSIWLNVNSDSAGCFVGCRNQDNDAGFVESYDWFNPTGLSAVVASAGGGWYAFYNVDMTLTSGWHNVTFTATKGALQFYVDGAAVNGYYGYYAGGTPQMYGGGTDASSDLTVGGCIADGNINDASLADFQLYIRPGRAAGQRDLPERHGPRPAACRPTPPWCWPRARPWT